MSLSRSVTQRRYPDYGPTLRYTNEKAREMEEKVEQFARLVNNDLYDLLKWASEQRERAEEAEASCGRLCAAATAAIQAWEKFNDEDIRVGPVYPAMRALSEALLLEQTPAEDGDLAEAAHLERPGQTDA